MFISSIVPSDANAYLDIINRTTREDLYCRFFNYIKYFDLITIKKFVDFNENIAMGFIAKDKNNKSLGVVHGFFMQNYEVEMSILVASDSRRRKVAFTLIVKLLEELKIRNYKYIIVYSLIDNYAFTGLAKSLQMKKLEQVSSVITWNLSLE